jgi:hypothetical protein
MTGLSRRRLVLGRSVLASVRGEEERLLVIAYAKGSEYESRQHVNDTRSSEVF